MSTVTNLDMLKEISFFEELESRHLEKLASMVRQVHFSADETIFKEGEIGDTVYLIYKGQVSIEIYVPGRRRVTVLTVGPGELLGWSPLLEGKPYTATGRTLMRTQALALNATELAILCQDDHELGCAFAWRVVEAVSNRLKATRLQLLDIFGPAE